LKSTKLNNNYKRDHTAGTTCISFMKNTVE